MRVEYRTLTFLKSLTLFSALTTLAHANPDVCTDVTIDAFTNEVKKTVNAPIVDSIPSSNDGSFLGSSRLLEYDFIKPFSPVFGTAVSMELAGGAFSVSPSNNATPKLVQLTYNNLEMNLSQYNGISFRLFASKKFAAGTSLEVAIKLSFAGGAVATAKSVLDSSTANPENFTDTIPFADFDGIAGVDLETDTLNQVIISINTNKVQLDYTVMPFVIGCTAPVLPVGYEYFNGKTKANGNLLTWKTEWEQNNDYFIVERFDEGTKRFEKVDTVDANRWGVYEFTDSEPKALKGSVRYRLVQIDTDGSAHYSEVISLARSSTSAEPENEYEITNVYPNPARTTVNVTANKGAKYSLFDSMGRQVKTWSGNSEAQTLDLGTQKSGLYYLRGVTEDGKKSSRVLTVIGQ